MNRFAELLDRLVLTPSRNGKLRLLVDYFRTVEDPDRGLALAAITGDLSIASVKPAMLRALVVERVDPVLFGYSYDYVGDLAETVSLVWPEPAEPPRLNHPLTLGEVVARLQGASRSDGPKILAGLLDALDIPARFATIKLVTGGLRIGVSARLAKQAVADLGGVDVGEIEELWHGLAPPYAALFQWLEGKAPKPESRAAALFRPVMLSHPVEDNDLARIEPANYAAEWKWDGIRVQAVSGRDANGHLQARLYSRTGEDITQSFPDLVPSLHLPGAIDGELLVLRDGRVQSFNVLQQRLNRKVVSPKLLKEFPIHLRAYDLLGDDQNDLRELPFAERRARLQSFVQKLDDPRIDLSPTVAFDNWAALMAARADPAGAGAGEDADAVEGVMLKRRDAPYLPGRPKGQWWKWKRDPHLIDAVLMYAQRGHGKRSSYYSDYTFGVWTGGDGGEQLVPVGKAYFGFTDEELLQIDRFVRRNTTEKFGPVRHVVHEPDQGLVLEVAFEGLQRSSRHKSGVAMRFPRINRLRWDKPPREADRLETLERMLKCGFRAFSVCSGSKPTVDPTPKKLFVSRTSQASRSAMLERGEARRWSVAPPMRAHTMSAYRSTRKPWPRA